MELTLEEVCGMIPDCQLEKSLAQLELELKCLELELLLLLKEMLGQQQGLQMPEEATAEIIGLDKQVQWKSSQYKLRCREFRKLGGKYKPLDALLQLAVEDSDE